MCSKRPGLLNLFMNIRYIIYTKALYGLHQAPRAWNQKLDEKLSALGFSKCPSEHAIYCRGKGDERTVVGVYVDDLVITGTHSSKIEAFKLQMAEVSR